MPSIKFGYARVSTVSQTLDQQRDALHAQGVEPDNVYVDQMSGARTDRPGLDELLRTAREGDEIVVVALDRLGRSMSHVIEVVSTLAERGVVLKSLRENVDFSTSMGRMVAGIFASLAEYERELIRERAAAARAAAAARGRHIGRPRALTDEQVQAARSMHQTGQNIAAISRTLNVSRATVYRALDPAA